MSPLVAVHVWGRLKGVVIQFASLLKRGRRNQVDRAFFQMKMAARKVKIGEDRD